MSSLIEYFAVDLRKCDINKQFFLNQQVLETVKWQLQKHLGEVHFTEVNLASLPLEKGEKYTASEKHWKVVFLVELNLIGACIKKTDEKRPAKALVRITMESHPFRMLGPRHDNMSNRNWSPMAFEVHFENFTPVNLDKSGVSMSISSGDNPLALVCTRSSGEIASGVTDRFAKERMQRLGLL